MSGFARPNGVVTQLADTPIGIAVSHVRTSERAVRGLVARLGERGSRVSPRIPRLLASRVHQTARDIRAAHEVGVGEHLEEVFSIKKAIRMALDDLLANDGNHQRAHSLHRAPLQRSSVKAGLKRATS
jgi:hypothetical protein